MNLRRIQTLAKAHPTLAWLISTALGTLAVALAMTWPLARLWTDGIWGILHDGIDSEWRIWAFRQVWEGRTGLRTFMLRYYPQGIPFLAAVPMYTSELLLALAGLLPMHAIPAYNCLLILKFLLAGTFMAAFLARCGLTSWAIAAGTLAYLINPYMMSTVRAYGPNFLSAALPAVGWSLLWWKDRRSVARFCVASLIILVAIGENYYYTYYALAVAALATVLYFVVRKRFLLALATAFAVAGLGTILSWGAHLAIAKGGNSYDAATAIRYGSQPLFYFVPAIDHRIFSRIFDPGLAELYTRLKAGQDTFELSQYLGLCILGLSVFALATRKSRRPIAIWFAGAAVLAMLSALAPVASALGKFSPGLAIFDVAPMFRHLSRFQLILAFSLAVTAAHGVQALPSRISSPLRALLLLVIAFEFWSGGSSRLVQNIRQRLPSPYAALASLPPAPIVESPAHYYRAMILMRTFQTIHNLPTEASVEKASRYRWESPEDQQRARAAGFRYWVIHRDMGPIVTSPFNDGGDQSWGDRRAPGVERFAYLRRLHHGADGELFEITDQFAVDAPMVFHRQGFYLDHDQDSSSRWTNAPSSDLELWSPATMVEHPTPYILRFKARGITPRNLSVHCGGANSPAPALAITQEEKVFSVTCAAPTASRTHISIVDDAPQRVIHDVVGNGDQRKVGVFLGDLTVTPGPSAP